MDYKDYKKGHSSSTFWYKGKNNLIDVLLSKYCKKGKRLKILEVGTGTGTELDVIGKYGDVYITDISKKAISMIPKKLYFEKRIANACNLPYKDNLFDVVVSFDVLEHISDDTKAVSEIKRVLNKKGIFIFSVPANPLLFGSHDAALGHKRRYSKNMLRKLLSGFNEIELNYWNSFLFIPSAIRRFLKRSRRPGIDYPPQPKLIDNFLFKFLKFENELIKKDFHLPFGMSIVGCCKNKT